MRNGDLFNLAFEEFLAWHIDNGIFYLSGRDIICMVIGFIVCLILWIMFDGREIYVRRRNEDKDISRD